MPAQRNSYSLWLAAQQNPQCPRPGPTGPSGNNGSTGATGPIGPAGQNGVSVGQNYFFNLSGNIITNTGPTGGNLDVYSYNAGQNTAYTGSDYFGYFIQQSATAATGSYVNVARFTSVAGLQPTIPRGVWTFYNNIYSFTGPTGTIGTWAIPPPPGTTNEVYAQVSYVDGPTGGKIFQTASKNINLSDDLVILNGYVQSPITLNNPTGAYFYVDYFATNPNSRNVIEFWTQGNSVAYVTTTFSPQQGSQGATGATGPQGPQGPAGTTLGSANRLAWFPTNNNVNSTPGITTDGNNLTVNGQTNTQAIAATSLNVTGTSTLVGGLISNGTTYLNGQTFTQAIASTKLDVTGVSTLVGGLVSNGTTFLGGQTNTQAIAATSLNVTGALTVGGDVSTQKLTTSNGALANWLWYGIVGQVGPGQPNQGTVINFNSALPNPFTRPNAPAEAIPPGFYCVMIQGAIGQITLAGSRPDRGGPPQAGLYDTLCYCVFTFWDGYVVRATGPGVPANQGAVFGRGNVTDGTINQAGLFNNDIGAFVQGSQLVYAANTGQGWASSLAAYVYRVC